MPRLSVIIPTCDRPETLRRCLDLLGPAPARECELIIADDSRATLTRTVIQDYPQVRWVRGPQHGPAANRNAGARAAQSPWLVFLDDDCEPAPGWIQTLLNATDDCHLDVIEGKTVCPNKRDSMFQEQVENLYGDLYWSCNLAIRRDVFAQLGGFDEDFTEPGGEDLELAWRIRRAGLRCWFLPEALVFHPPRQLTWGRLWWRALFMRWHLLYRLKTEQSLPLPTPAARVCCQLIGRQSIELLRSTFHLFSRFDRAKWRTAFAGQCWQWITFPILLPYLIYWDLRFRRCLSRAKRGLGVN